MRFAFRFLCVVLVVAGAAAGLSACSTKVGAAAVVGGQRIPEAQVTKQILSTSTAGASSRLTVVAFLVQARLYEQADQKLGVRVSDSELRAAQAPAAATFIGGNGQIVAGQAGVAVLAKLLPTIGVAGSFAGSMLRTAELEYLTVSRLKITTQAALTARLASLHIPVSVSPRYGSWDAKLQSVGAVTTPPFLALKPTPSPSPAA